MTKTIEELNKAMDDAADAVWIARNAVDAAADAVWIARNAYDAAKKAYEDALKEAE